MSKNNPLKQTLGAFYASFDGLLLTRRLCALTDGCWPTLEGKRVLTIGYATPFIRFLENKQPASLTETDFESDAEKSLALKMPETAFPFQNNTFDAVFAIGILEHAAFPNKMLREIYRILKTGGTLICVSANPQMPWHSVKKSPATDGTRRTAFETAHLLTDNFFTVRNQRQTLFFPSCFYRMLRDTEKADKLLSFLPFFGAFTVTESVKEALEALPVPFLTRMKKRFSLSAADSRKSVTETPLKK